MSMMMLVFNMVYTSYAQQEKSAKRSGASLSSPKAKMTRNFPDSTGLEPMESQGREEDVTQVIC